MKKLIGVVSFYNEERQKNWLPPYLKLLMAVGATPLVLPLTGNKLLIDCFFEAVGGFLLVGGDDVSPQFYGCEKMPWCGENNPARDEMEAYVLKKALETDKSLLGVCRGIQIMNACFGGTLYQDLEQETGTAVNHRMAPPFDRRAHMVRLDPESPFRGISDGEQLPVNSLHHQAVKELAPGFKAWAWAEDGTVEGIYLPEKKFFAAVQWHPELHGPDNEHSMKLFKAFSDSLE